MNLTLIVQQGSDGWLVGQLAEFPAVITQGRDLKELRFMVRDALRLALDVERELTEIKYFGKEVTKESFELL